MEDLGIVQSRCPECGTVMRDVPSGFRCAGCGYLEDHSAELAEVIVPPEFEGPAIQGG
jgi:tRNA(Ile2) C34 agmatinyltransferase TiaS